MSVTCKRFMLNVVVLNVIMLNVVMLNVVLLNVVTLKTGPNVTKRLMPVISKGLY
jgi:hypothetical protein